MHRLEISEELYAGRKMGRPPADFHQFIGQRRVVGHIERLIEGAKKAGDPCTSMLLTGPAGSGNNLGNALAGRGQTDEAIAHYRKVLELKPDYVEAHNNLGNVLARLGQTDEAIAHYHKVLELRPDYAEAHYNLGVVLVGLGRFDEAIVHYRKALEAKPGYTDARNNLGLAQSQREGILRGLAARHESLRSRPDDIALLNDIAWTLATNPNASIRNGSEAVELAGRAVQLSGGQEPAVLGTLAAAYAEAGRFFEALQTARKAAELATGQGKHPLAESINAKIRLYEARTAFREMPQPAIAGSTQP